MESKPAFRSAPLLDRALRIASQRAQTYDSLAESLGVTPEDAALYWFSINSLRRGLGHDLPPLSASARCWYDPTWHLEALLETFQINEGLASHYGRIFYDPEGGHLELNMAANEVVYAIGLEHPDIDVARLRRVCVHACEPECGIELLAANAGKVLLSIEEYRDEAITPAFVEMLYARLVAGIEAVPEDVSARVEGLELLCSFINGDTGPLKGQCRRPSPYCGADGSVLRERIGHVPCGQCPVRLPAVLAAPSSLGLPFLGPCPRYALALRYRQRPVRPRARALRRRGGRADAAVRAGGSGRGIRRHLRLDVRVRTCRRAYFGRAALGDDQTRGHEPATRSAARHHRRRRLDERRQKEVLLEAVLHSNAEFTYDIHMKRYAISYPSARSDFGRLMDLGFLQQSDDGVRHFFFANDDLHERCRAYLREHCAEAYLHYYDDEGRLRPEFRATDEASALYNRDIGFYEKALLDKMYTEHYDFRRASIADSDGLIRRSPTRD